MGTPPADRAEREPRGTPRRRLSRPRAPGTAGEGVMPGQGPQAALRSRARGGSAGRPGVLGIPGSPSRQGPRPAPCMRGVLVDPVHRMGKRSARACARRDRAPAAPRPRIPLWERGPRGRPPAAPTRQAAAPADYPLLPRPSPGPRAPARRERGRRGGHPNARRRAGGAPPPSPFPSTRPSPRTPREGGTGANPRRPAGGGARDPPTARPAPRPGRGAGEGEAAERAAGTGKRARGEEGERTPDSRRGRGGGTSDKPLCRGLTFNRSQRGSCSATYETPTQKQVVYEWFSTRFPTNVRCVTGEGAAPFPAAPRFPGRGALRTGPRSRRAAGHATPRGARAAAHRRGRRGTGYPRPTEAPRRCRIVPPGRDSDLEAFSHNPTDGSFAPLAPQPSTYTKCLNLRFLSY